MNVPIRFKVGEFQSFSWLYSAAPCFPVSATKVSISEDPKKFYDTLCDRFGNAKNRISVASLYVGNGNLENNLLESAKENLINRKTLTLSLLLDYQRGTRGNQNSVTLFQKYFLDLSEQCKLYLYQTPRLQGLWSKVLPSRYNEIVGLQHMKLYIVDDRVLLSGANCSNDYFMQRQDRYIEIDDPDLANFYRDIIDEVSKYSKRCENQDIVSDKKLTKEKMIQDMKNNICNVIYKWQQLQLSKLSTSGDSSLDTWVFPLIQMGEFNITQDEYVTRKLMVSAPKGSHLQLATGYFNLTEQYTRTLLDQCKANVSLLMAHPNANGFLGAAGPAGGIPFAYSLIAKQFWQRVVDSNQASRIRMLEYERPGWTFHAKGLWYYPPGSDVPWATVIGSANLGERSVKRDLEAQAAIFTVSPELQARLQQETKRLHSYSKECGEELLSRETPKWVRATVKLFRTYF